MTEELNKKRERLSLKLGRPLNLAENQLSYWAIARGGQLEQNAQRLGRGAPQIQTDLANLLGALDPEKRDITVLLLSDRYGNYYLQQLMHRGGSSLYQKDGEWIPRSN